MVKFIMQGAATMRLYTHQTKLENMRATLLIRSRLHHFQDVLPENMEYILCCAFYVSSPFIKSAG